MVIPATYSVVLLLAALTLVLWGSWANTLRTAGKWRFELYCYDFAFGALLLAGIAAMTLGTLGHEITFLDNLTIVRKRQIAYALAGGGLFGLGNMLMLGAISIAGMATAFPIAVGFACATGVIINFLYTPQGSHPALMFTGCGIILLSIGVFCSAFLRLQKMKIRQSGDVVTRVKKNASSQLAWKGIVLAIVGGLLMGTFYPAVEWALRGGEIEMGAYPVAFAFSVGVLVATVLCNFYFLNLPVQGQAISLFAYFRGTLKQHLFGMFGGALWCAGLICYLAVSSAAPEVTLPRLLLYSIAQGGAVIGAVWGMLYWKEFSLSSRVRSLIWAATIVCAIGIAVIGISQSYAPK